MTQTKKQKMDFNISDEALLKIDLDVAKHKVIELAKQNKELLDLILYERSKAKLSEIVMDIRNSYPSEVLVTFRTQDNTIILDKTEGIEAVKEGITEALTEVRNPNELFKNIKQNKFEERDDLKYIL